MATKNESSLGPKLQTIILKGPGGIQLQVPQGEPYCLIELAAPSPVLVTQ